MQEIYEVFLSAHARDDLAEIFEYIGADSRENTAAFLSAVEEKIRSLATMPERAPMIPENVQLGTGYRHLVHDRYRIIFRIQGTSVLILRVVHGARLLQM